MFALKLWSETGTHILLIAVILFNALIPSSALAKSNSVLPQINNHAVNSQNPELTDVLANFQQLPISFVPNVGQEDADGVQFQAQGLGGNLFFTREEVVFSLFNPVDVSAQHPDEGKKIRYDLRQASVLRTNFVDANLQPEITTMEALPGVVNYLKGTDSSKWFTDLPTYSGIVYQELYPGIELHYEGTGGILKSSFYVAPSANSAAIVWKYKGADSVIVDGAGNLIITLPSPAPGEQGTVLTEKAPIAWQEINGSRTSVTVQYKLDKKGKVSFMLPNGYDTTLPLVIDPELTASTYLGGSKTDEGDAITVDADGNIYLTGSTASTNFPIVNQFQTNLPSTDVFVTKLNPIMRTVLYSSYLGGNQPDHAWGIRLDSQGRITLVGETESSDFPTLNAYDNIYGGGTCEGAPCDDVFVAQLSANGSGLRYSTYLGASGSDEGIGMTLGANDQIFLTGNTNATGFPTVNAFDSTYGGGTCSTLPCPDGFVARIDPALSGTASLLYSTYFGGNKADKGKAIAVDANGRVYVVGYTDSTDFSVRNAYQSTKGTNTDTFISKFDLTLSGNNSLLYSTYFGGNESDHAYGMALNGENQVYFTGFTQSSNFPGANNTFGGGTCASAPCYDAYLAGLNIANNTVLYSTYLGGSNEDRGNGIVLDSYGNAYVTGYTMSTNFPLANEIQPSKGGDSCAAPPCADAFVAKVNTSGNATIYSTYLGGDAEDYGQAITVDSLGSAYITGYTFSTNFPTTNGSGISSTTYSDAFVAKIFDPQPATPTPTNTFTATPTVTPTPTATATRIPAGVSCIDWRDASAHGWVQSPWMSAGTQINWDSNGMYGSATNNGTYQVAAYFQMPTVGFYKVVFTGQSLTNITVAQGTSAPTSSGPLSNVLTADPDGSYSVTAAYLEIKWSITAPIDLATTPLFQSFCYSPFTPTATNTPTPTNTPSATPSPTNTQTPTSTSTPVQCTTWNIANDFRVAPNQENPNRDSCNNPNIWEFMGSGSLTRDPATYYRVTTFTPSIGGYTGLDFWSGTYVDGNGQFPSIGVNDSGETRTFNGHITFPVNAADIHPGPNQLGIIAWHSPLTGFVSITGGVSDNDAGGGDGILWFIDENSTNLASGTQANGGAQEFKNGADGIKIGTIAVNTGDTLYFVIHPNGNYLYDNTRVDITINAITPIATGTLPSQNNGGPAIVTVSGLSIGTQYRIMTTGVYNYGPGIIDAQWSDYQHTYGCFCLYGQHVNFNGTYLAAINGQTVYDPNHQYIFLWTADTTQLQMYLGDSVYSDNSGYLTYQIFDNSQSPVTLTPTPTGPTPTNTSTPVNTPTVTPTNTSAPSTSELVIPGWIGSPAQQATVSGVVTITLASGVTLQSGMIDYWPVNDLNQRKDLNTVSNISGGGALATLDTTTLANGSYVIRLQGTDSNGHQQDSGILITVTGEYKPGRVRFTITDLTIPVAGLPITIARTYDSLDRSQVGDFAYGWSLDIGNPKLEINPAHDVTITMPDGRRSTFYFTPQHYAGVFGIFMYPQYTPEAGVYGSLTSNGCDMLVLSGGQYFCFLEGDYLPTEYTYTDPYGRKFVMSADGTLKTITDLNNNVLTFSPTGITSSAGNINVLFHRDAQGRIDKITYPAGKDYVYDYKNEANVDTGELRTVTYPSVTLPDNSQQIIVLRYDYFSDHSFKEATDPRGYKPAITTYDSSGRMDSVTDAAGNKTTYSYDLTTHTTTVHYLGDPADQADDLGDAVLIYNNAGYLKSYRDPLGATTLYDYDPTTNKLIKVTDPLTHATQYTYNTDGHPTSIIDPLNHTLGTVQYNKYGGPTTLTTAQGGNAIVQYDLVTFMPLSASDSMGSLGAYHWTPQGNPDIYTDQYGQPTNYTYTAQGYVETKTDALTHVTHYAYDAFGRVTDIITAYNTADASTTHYKYDELGRQAEVTVAFGTSRAATTKYEYDANGNRTAVVDPLGRRAEYQYDNANRLVLATFAAHAPSESTQTKYVYDFYGRLTDVTIAFGTTDASTTHYIYDSAGRKTNVTTAYLTASASTTHYVYYADGRVQDVTTAYGTVDAATIHYAYDAAGRTTNVTVAPGQPEASTTHYEYYDSGLLKSTTTASGTNLAASTLYFYDSRGRSTTTQYPDGTTTTQGYDIDPNAAGWVDSTTDQGGVTTKYVYDQAGRLDQLISSAIDPQTNQVLQHITNYDYDAANRLTDTFDPLNHHTSFTYYPTGQMATSKSWLNGTTGFTTTSDYNLAGEQISALDANSHLTQYQYNERGLLKKTIYPPTAGMGEFATSQIYDGAGRLISSTDENGIVTHSAYDPAGQLISVTLGYGTTDATTTQYGYNFAGQLASITDAKNHVASFQYNHAGQQTRKTLPDTTTYEQFGYNAAGNMVSHRLEDGNTNTFRYDRMNRLTDTVYFDGRSIVFEYTSGGQRKKASLYPAPLSVPQVYNYTYDPFQRLKQITYPDGRAVSYTYDDNDQRASMTTPAGTINYGYNNLDQLVSVTTGTQTTTYQYDSVGFLTQRLLPNGGKTVYTPNERDQLKNVTVTNSSNTPLLSFAYDLDKTGNRTKVTELGGSSITWGYDSLYRLTGETRRNSSNTITWQAGFTYDAAGNRASMTVNGATTNYTYNALDQLTNIGAVTYNYDGRGNLNKITNGTQITNYSYDAADQLSNVTLPNNTSIAYAYDADGRRVKQTVGSTVTNYQWDEASPYGDVVNEYNSSGSTLASYILGDTGLISQTRGTTSYFLQDGQGSTRALTSSTGAVTDSYSYNAFGDSFNRTGTTTNPYQYTGQQFDSQTGLYNLRARYYNPALGRFLSQDTYPVNFNNPVELNRYGYAENNPINGMDPSGHLFIEYLVNTAKSIGNAGAALGGTAVYTYLLALNTPWVVTGLLLVGGTVEGSLLYRALFLGDQDAAFSLASLYQLTGYSYSALIDLASRLSGISVTTIIRAMWGHPNARQANINLDDFVSRVFKGDYKAYNEFVTRLENGLPPGTKVYARGSSITGYKWTVGRSFDALGEGTSDLDLVLVGNDAMKAWKPSEFNFPGMYTANLGNETPDVAPSLNALRVDLQNLINRPLNIQAASQLFVDTRLFIQQTKYIQILPQG